MEMKKLSKAFVIASIAATAAPAAFAAEGAPDFSTIMAGLAIASISTAIMAAGGMKATVNFIRWGANKVSTFMR